VAADGRLSRMREWAGIVVKRPKRRRFGRRRHVSIRPWADLVEVHWGTSCEVYVTPVGPELVGVAALTGDRPVDFDRCLAQFPALADRLAGARVASEDRGAGPFGQRPEHVVAGRLALVGDASGCLDPITGEGLSLAFGQAAAVVAAIVDGDLSYYAARHRGMARLPAAITRFLLAVEQRPDLRRRLIRTFAAWPRLFGRLVDLVGAAGLSPSGGSAR
jgi:flavin-dependent dehydrogenase